ncbi:MAG: hypothetical protein P8Y45_04815 [Exilibacterium sp.]
MRGIAVTDGDEVLGIVACVSNMILAEVSEKLKSRRKMIIRAWREFISRLPAGTYYAVRDKSIESSGRFLNHFGFELMSKDIYVYRGEQWPG